MATKSKEQADKKRAGAKRGAKGPIGAKGALRATRGRFVKDAAGAKNAPGAEPVSGAKGQSIVTVRVGGNRAQTSAGLRSKITERGQTTLPSGVRRQLGLDAGSEVQYEIRGEQVIMRKVVEVRDPAIGSFLDFLERDMVAHPDSLTPVTKGLVARLRGLTEGVVVGADEAIEGPVAL